MTSLATLDGVLRACADAVGGPKAAGVRLWPDLGCEPDRAAQKLADHINPGRRARLKPEQVVSLLRGAQAAGVHEPMHAFCRLCGYAPPAPITPLEEAAELMRGVTSAQAHFDHARRELMTFLDTYGLQPDAMGLRVSGRQSQGVRNG